MDGAKASRRYLGARLEVVSGREASWSGRSRAARSGGPTLSADPGGSNIEVEWESRPPKGLGFPGNASSAGG